MERKNQICEAGQQYLDSMDEFQRYHTYPREAFIDGAKWADEHPNTKTLKSITTNKKILKVWCKRNMSTHTDWTGTRVETINACRSINEFVDKLWNYLEEESDKMD